MQLCVVSSCTCYGSVQSQHGPLVGLAHGLDEVQGLGVVGHHHDALTRLRERGGGGGTREWGLARGRGGGIGEGFEGVCYQKGAGEHEGLLCVH